MEKELFSKIRSYDQKEKEASSRLQKLLGLLHFNLHKREQQYHHLKKELAALLTHRESCQHQIKSLERNLLIYRQNVSKIELHLESLYQESGEVKAKYDNLLTGSVSDIIRYTGEHVTEPTLTEDSSNPELTDESGYMLVKLKKQSLLSSLNTIFRQYEEKVRDLKKEKEHSLGKKEEIMDKMVSAEEKKEKLYSAHGSYQKEIGDLREVLSREVCHIKKTLSIKKEILGKMRLVTELKEEIRPLLAPLSKKIDSTPNT